MEGADSVGAGQLREEIKIECPFSSVTNSRRVWRREPERDARSVKRYNNYIVSHLYYKLPLNSWNIKYSQDVTRVRIYLNTLSYWQCVCARDIVCVCVCVRACVRVRARAPRGLVCAYLGHSLCKNVS